MVEIFLNADWADETDFTDMNRDLVLFRVIRVIRGFLFLAMEDRTTKDTNHTKLHQKESAKIRLIRPIRVQKTVTDK